MKEKILNKIGERMKIEIKNLELKDFERYKELAALDKEWHKWNGPYFKKDTQEEFEKNMNELEGKLKKGEELKNKHIYIDNELAGEVSWYWRSKETLWLDMGLLIMDESYWGKGIGTKVLKIWIDRIFEEMPELVRVGYTTWSGNKGMMKVGEKLGMVKEACFRNARILGGKYYDSVSYGVLREEWENKIK